MGDVAVGVTALTLNTSVAIPATVVAVEDGVNGTEKFVITPTKADAKIVLRFTVADTHGAVALSVAAGDFWASTGALSLSVAQATTGLVVLEGAKYTKANGTIEVTATPAVGKKLKTDHALTVSCFQLP